MNATIHAFERQGSRLTLAAGLAEYHQKNPGLVKGRELSPEAQLFFQRHDVVHVVYGCGTSLPDEAIVKIASMLGTTGGLGVLSGYRLHELIEVYRNLPLIATLRSVAFSSFLIPRTVWRCLRQCRRWPWEQFEPYMNRPLCELRSEFGIRVAHFGDGDGD
jgi:hypothetical protein